MKFREHRGSLRRAMETVVDLPNREALLKHIQNIYKGYGRRIKDSNLSVEPYIFDDRIKWNTYIVCVKGLGVVGFTNGPCKE